MSNHPTDVRPPAWRVLVHDPDPDDPKLLLCVVIDVSPAWPRVNPATIAEATEWAASRAGLPTVTLVPVNGARAWTVDGGRAA
jgi:hypothetical protein